MKPSELFCFKDKKNFAALLFSLVACTKKFQRENATDIASDGNDPPDDWLKTGWSRNSQTRARLVDSLICCASSNKFCRLDDEIPPGVGRKFLLQNGTWVSELWQCCFVWSEIVGPHSSGNFNDWPLKLKLKAGSKMWVVVIGVR